MIKMQLTTLKGNSAETFKGLSTIAVIMPDQVTNVQVLVFIINIMTKENHTNKTRKRFSK